MKNRFYSVVLALVIALGMTIGVSDNIHADLGTEPMKPNSSYRGNIPMQPSRVDLGTEPMKPHY